ncbi:ABC transporter ATP-binding protein [Actinoplanes subtropicus]|uniref:ABC transporter ATP-binding protein n=1 Tax=Actinoplanes subtropicus TaxID=543632 RepID=UPI0005562167|nr:ABC transporter ATP-binding protein [Actinoplanes subtropicus]
MVVSGDDLAIRARALRKCFGARVAVAGVDLEVPAGTVFGFLGPNGAGKTTLIRMLLGLTRASDGHAWLLGLPVPQRRTRALARVGAVVEEPGFHRYLTGRENLRIAAAARGGGAGERIGGALERVGLGDRADDRVGRYSLGMRQRLGIARCLLSDPALLILDEPVNGLDPAGIREMRVLIRSFADEGRTVFLSSHLLDEVQRVCDRIAVVDAGRVVAQGATEELVGADALMIEVADSRAAAGVLAGLPLVRAVDEVRDGVLRVRVFDIGQATALLARELAVAGIAVHRLEAAPASLERAFLELTGRSGAER